MKNWLPFVFGPEFAIASAPRLDGQLERALLVVELVARVARTVAARAATLDHEVLDHAVER